jgi:uroporphyrinogen-III synthase
VKWCGCENFWDDGVKLGPNQAKIDWSWLTSILFMSQPLTQKMLTQKTVLVTRSLGQSSEFTTLLQAQGATVIEMPALAIQPPSDWAGLDQAIGQIADYDWLILTSSNAVDFFTQRLLAMGKDYRQLVGVKVAVVGEKTAQSLQQKGLNPDYIPPNFVADSLLEHFPENPQNKRILFPRVESGGREVLVKQFTAQGADVTEVAAYQSGCPETIDPIALNAIEHGEVNIITFASSKTVKHFCQLLSQALGDRWLNVLDAVIIASIGPQTSETCRSLLGRVDIEATEYTLAGLTAAIVEFVSQKPVP